MTLSTVGFHTIAGEQFRASEWTAGHLEHTIAVLGEKHPKCQLVILQPCYHTGVDVSAFTHDYDCVLDVKIIGMTWATAQAFLRALGWAAWHRTPAQGFSDHIHMASIPAGLSGHPTAEQVGAAYAKLGLVVGKYIDGGYTTSNPHQVTATCQVADYFVHAYGLKDNHVAGADKSWFPPNIAETIYHPGQTAAVRQIAGTPTYLDVTVALARFADETKNPDAKPIYLKARTIVGKLVKDGRQVRVPKSTAEVIKVLAAKRAATKSYWTKFRLTRAINLLKPLT